MSETYDVVITGAGPGGLACACHLARNGVRVLVLERNKIIGPKVCAGGITWSGVIGRVPEQLIEQSFKKQYIFSPKQKVLIREENPIIATVNRTRLGQWMAGEALRAGAEIRTGSRVTAITSEYVTICLASGKESSIRYSHLVGADGSTSLVRRFLGIPTEKIGVGINYQLAATYEKMEWHLDPKRFGSGYAWIFPHRNTISIGGYVPGGICTPSMLRKNLLHWAGEKGFDLKNEPARAQRINYDYRGHHFDNIHLIGDAAGLASGLTGEGIYPAIVSGEATAQKIIYPDYPEIEMEALLKNQLRHNRIVSIAGKNKVLCTLLIEFLITLLRLKIIDFHTLEMAD